MEQRISLCITYVYHDAKGQRPSIYRIADYEDGEYLPVDPQFFTDEQNDFSPKFLRSRPGDDSPLYTPILRSWKAIPKYDDESRMTTESYLYNYGQIFEVVLNRPLMDSDPVALQNKLRQGFSLPDGVRDTFLLVLDQDDTTYTVAKCRKSMLRKTGDRYFFVDKVHDMLHATHYLETFVLNKCDIIDTTRFSGFFTEDKSTAPIRLFYRYDSLPDSDGLFYLREIAEYIPFFVSRFIKKEYKRFDFSKAQLQKIVEAIEEAAASSEAIESFFSVTGYDVETVKGLLPTYQQELVTALLGYDEIDKVLAGFLETSDLAFDRFLTIARNMWFDQADDERTDVEDELQHLRRELQTANTQLDTLIAELEQTKMLKEEAYQEIERLNKQRTDVEKAAAIAVEQLDATIGSRLADYSFIKHLTATGAGNYTPVDNTNFVAKLPAKREKSAYKQTDDLAKANAALQANLKKAGMSPYYSSIVAIQIHNASHRTNAFILSGMYAKNFANAVSNSIDAQDATVITVTSTQPSYAQMCNAIETAPGRVVIVENLLDYCNEVLFSSLCRDYRNHIFVFSIDNEHNLGLLSRSIWNYAWYINSDLAFNTLEYNVTYNKVIVDGLDTRIPVNYSLEGYDELNATLLKLSLPMAARANVVGLVRFFHQHYTITDPQDMLNDVIAKLCYVYRSTLSDETVNDILESLPEELISLYFEG